MCKVGNWELYGTKRVFVSHYEWEVGFEEEENLVATFSTEEQAESYVKAALLKNQPAGYDSPFRKKSLLRGYDGCEIREKEDPHIPPHDPCL
jgi:hypothetical protein